jgi:hypothetical protein
MGHSALSLTGTCRLACAAFGTHSLETGVEARAFDVRFQVQFMRHFQRKVFSAHPPLRFVLTCCARHVFTAQL